MWPPPRAGSPGTYPHQMLSQLLLGGSAHSLAHCTLTQLRPPRLGCVEKTWVPRSSARGQLGRDSAPSRKGGRPKRLVLWGQQAREGPCCHLKHGCCNMCLNCKRFRAHTAGPPCSPAPLLTLFLPHALLEPSTIGHFEKPVRFALLFHSVSPRPGKLRL